MAWLHVIWLSRYSPHLNRKEREWRSLLARDRRPFVDEIVARLRQLGGKRLDIDWEWRRATCPEGRTSVSWTPPVDNPTNAVIKLKLAAADCRACPSRADCTQVTRARRTLTIRPWAQYAALQAARARAETRGFATKYVYWAGIEGTLSRGIRRCGLHRRMACGYTTSGYSSLTVR